MENCEILERGLGELDLLKNYKRYQIIKDSESQKTKFATHFDFNNCFFGGHVTDHGNAITAKNSNGIGHAVSWSFLHLKLPFKALASLKNLCCQ